MMQAPVTEISQGALGLDYNYGFIQLCETNDTGNILGFRKYPLPHMGQDSNTFRTELQQQLHTIVELAASKNKTIIKEKLSFTTARASVKGKARKDKAYHRMVHSFGDHLYAFWLDNIAYRHAVQVISVPAYNTSKIGIQKYGQKKGLNRHQAASYVIGRKGQGFIDKLVKNKK